MIESETAHEGRRAIANKRTKKALGLPRETKMRSDEQEMLDLDSVYRIVYKREEEDKKRAQDSALRAQLPSMPPGETVRMAYCKR